jgi:hypothetical protein
MTQTVTGSKWREEADATLTPSAELVGKVSEALRTTEPPPAPATATRDKGSGAPR